MSILFNLRNTGGYIYGMGTASIAATNADMPQTNPLSPITLDKLVVSSDGSAAEQRGVTIEKVTVNDTDILLSIGGSAQGAPLSMFKFDSATNPSVNLFCSMQDVVTVKVKDNLSSSALNASASWTGAYSDAGSGIESATPAEAPRFGTGRYLAFGESTSSGTTISGQPNSAQPLMLDYFNVEAKRDASNGTAQITGLAINAQDLITVGSGSVAAEVWNSDSVIHALYGLMVSSADTLSFTFTNNGTTGSGFVCAAYSARVAS